MKSNEQIGKSLQQVLQESRAESAALRKLIEALHKDSQKQTKRKNDSPESFPSKK
jgi:phytoene/squalene synthetase